MKARSAFVLTALGASVAALSLYSTPAFAAGNAWSVYTTDDNPGGRAEWYGAYSGTQERLGACDDQADGYRVVATVRWSGGSKTVTAANGAGTCVFTPSSWGLAEGTTVSVTACLRDGANGADKYCRTKSGLSA